MKYKYLIIISVVIGSAILFISGCSSPTEEPLIPDIQISERKTEKTQKVTSTPRATTEPTTTETHTPTNSSTVTLTKTTRPSLTPTAIPEGVEIVKLITPDGVDLVGYLHRPEAPLNEKYVVVLAHGHTQSHAEWESFARLLSEIGIASMSFDFRGHGTSGGTDQFETIGIDVKTVFDFVRNQGYERVVCVGASSGGSACLAGVIGESISGLVMLSSMRNLPGTNLVSSADIKALAIPKIIMFSENDIWFPDLIKEYEKTAELAGEPKDVYIFPGIGHGTELFYDENGEEVIAILLDFLKELIN